MSQASFATLTTSHNKMSDLSVVPGTVDGCLKRLGLSHNPFVMAPNIVNFYSPPHIEAMIVEVLHLIETRMGFGLLYGDVGLGKTTLSRRILFELDRRGIQSALVFNTFFQGAELLREINRDFDIPVVDPSLQGQMTALNRYLLEQRALDNNCVIIIDDAQSLTVESLELVRQISNMETGIDKIVQIILIGQPELEDKLNLHELRQLRSRIVLKRAFRPYTRKETDDYIRTKIARSGERVRVEITDAAVRRVHAASLGISRRINVIMGRCLYCAVAENTHVITGRIVNMAARDVEESTEPAAAAGSGRRALVALVLVALLAAPWLLHRIEPEYSFVPATWIESINELAGAAMRSVGMAPTIVDAASPLVTRPQPPDAASLSTRQSRKHEQQPVTQSFASVASPHDGISAPALDADAAAQGAGAEGSARRADGEAARVSVPGPSRAAATGATELSVNPAVRDFLAVYGLTRFAGAFETALEAGRLGPVSSEIAESTGLRLVAIPTVVADIKNTYATLRVAGSAPDTFAHLLFWKPETWPAESFSVFYRPPAVSDLQTALSEFGAYNYFIDGVGGPRTIMALKAFQRGVGLPVTGAPDVETLFMLEFLNPVRRAEVAQTELRPFPE